MKAKRGFVVVIAVIITVLIGCTSNTYHAEKQFTSAADNTNYFHDFSLFIDSEEFLPGASLGEILLHSDISQLEFNVRNDLGFPRIERIINSYEQTIKRYSNRYGFDWRFILAVMNQESRFRIQAVSHRGAYGLMQIMPGTGMDVSRSLGLDGVHQPEDNIAGGVYYLWRVQSMFNSPEISEETHDDLLRLSLAAYNAGPTRIRDAQRLAVYLELDPHRWEVIRDLLPMLSRRYYTLHQYVWENGRPAGGYFYGWPETTNYVESVMGYYSYYKLIFDQS